MTLIEGLLISIYIIYINYYEFNICTSFLIIYMVYRNRNIFNINIQLINNNKELEYNNKDIEHENKEIKSFVEYIKNNNFDKV